MEGFNQVSSSTSSIIKFQQITAFELLRHGLLLKQIIVVKGLLTK